MTIRLVLIVAVAVKAITFVLCGMSERTSAMLANSVRKFSPLQSKYVYVFSDGAKNDHYDGIIINIIKIITPKCLASSISVSFHTLICLRKNQNEFQCDVHAVAFVIFLVLDFVV